MQQKQPGGVDSRSDLTTSDIKPFIGSNDFEVSRDFYVAMGWKVNFEGNELAELELGGHRFYLQRYFQRKWCENSMLHITDEDAEAWYRHATEVLEKQEYGTARVNPPVEQD